MHNKTKDDRGCEAAIALQQSRGEMRHAPVSGSCRCVGRGKSTHRKPAKNLPFIIYRQCYNFVTGRLQVYYKSGKGIDKRGIYE